METKEKIVSVAGRLFARQGYEGVSVRDIVARADVNLGAITYHFGGKEELFAEVLARKVGPLKALGEKIVRSKCGPAEKLRDILEAYAMAVMHDDPGTRVLMVESLAGGARLPQAARDAVAWRNRLVGDLIREGIRQKTFRKCDVEATAWIFFGMLTPYLMYQPLMPRGLRYGAYPKAYVRRVVTAALDIFMDGLYRKPSRSRQWAKRRKQT